MYTYPLLAEFSVCAVNYGPSFFQFILVFNSWFARDVRDVSIFGYPPCWCSTASQIYICLYAIAEQLLEITMDFIHLVWQFQPHFPRQAPTV